MDLLFWQEGACSVQDNGGIVYWVRNQEQSLFVFIHDDGVYEYSVLWRLLF